MTILYIFITWEQRLEETVKRVGHMMNKMNRKNYIIVTGNNNGNSYDAKTKIMNILCNDLYDGLPEKVVNTMKYLKSLDEFKQFEYFCKLDDDMIYIQDFDVKTFTDYCGIVSYISEGARDWHLKPKNKLSDKCKYKNKSYDGIYVPYCLGGNGYILSRKSLEIISNYDNDPNEIYEDLYIGKILLKHDIHPTGIQMKYYVVSPDHR